MCSVKDKNKRTFCFMSSRHFIFIYGRALVFPTINCAICSDGLHKFLVNVHFNVGTRQNLTYIRYSHVTPRVFQFTVVFCAQCSEPCSCAAESREYIYISYPEILIFSYTAYSVHITSTHPRYGAVYTACAMYVSLKWWQARYPAEYLNIDQTYNNG